jgi:excisionase family DNA binding protein
MKNEVNPEHLLTAAQVAEMLGISRAKAYEMFSRGLFPTVRIDNLVRVRRGDLERYIREKTQLGNSSITNAK